MTAASGAAIRRLGPSRRPSQEIGSDEARSRNREYLIRRILWLLQAGAYGPGPRRLGRDREAP